ncbi:porin [Shewanella intestini]|uniref:Porin n=1 Tax=Shewanella intestini TaxID=2017544 RepID=A0ABS5I293_9GAMM|nr:MULTISPECIES: porin [Shewanella]MBR9728158.1 porin [Shewanella intestini]MRG36629.1 porin [Shewanella sp. XMDDZSB0408]
MKTIQTLVAVAVSAVCFNASAAEQSLEQQVATLNARVQQLESVNAPAATTTSSFKNSSVSLYGSLRPTLTHNTANESNWDVGDALSRIGIKASTQISDGLSVFADGEWSVDMSHNGDFGKARLAYVGLATDYGSVSIGRQRPAQYTVVGSYVDIFNNSNSPFGYNEAAPFFMSNSVNYQVSASGVTFIAGAMFDGEYGGATGGNNGQTVDMYNVAVGYDLDKLHLGLGYVSTENTVGQNKDLLGGVAAYSFDNGIYVAGSYQVTDHNVDQSWKTADAQDNNGHTADLVATFPLAAHYDVKAGVSLFDDGIDNLSSRKFKSYNTTFEWLPASNVCVHLEYLRTDFDSSAKDTDNAVTVGLRYNFDMTWKS